MATRDEAISTNGYSSTVRKVMQVGAVGTILPQAVEVSSTATALPTTALTSRKAFILYNNGSNTVYLGNSDVDTTDGYPLLPGAEKAFDFTDELTLYGITESGVSDVRIMEGS